MLDYIYLGIMSVLNGPALFHFGELGIPASLVMLVGGLFTGIAVGATPGLAGPMAMAISLPLLISAFGFGPEALLPVFAFLIGIMKGATIGGAVPAILFNMPGTPDALMTTLDGHPMAKNGQPKRALRIAQLSSVAGDTFSDIVLIVCAPFLAIMIEAYLDLPEKTALLILSISFIAAVMGASVGKGLLSVSLGLIVAFIATGNDLSPRLTMGVSNLREGIPLIAAVLGVLIVGEIFTTLEKLWRNNNALQVKKVGDVSAKDGLQSGDIGRITPYVMRGAIVGTIIGALPGVGSTLAATLSYSLGKKYHKARRKQGEQEFGTGVPEGIAATESANSAVSGANLIPVLSLGIPGNAAAVFLILAADSIGGFNPGPSVFTMPPNEINPQLVTVFGIFTLMAIGNLLNWTVGGAFMRSMGVLALIPATRLLPIVLLVSLTAIYVQETSMFTVWATLAFGVLGYVMRKLDVPVLPFVISFILAGPIERSAREAFSASGGDAWFLFSSPTSVVLLLLSLTVLVMFSRNDAK